jgi:hypothetical protein
MSAVPPVAVDDSKSTVVIGAVVIGDDVRGNVICLNESMFR